MSDPLYVEFVKRTGGDDSLLQIFIDNKNIGGFAGLEKLHRSDELSKMTADDINI